MTLNCNQTIVLLDCYRGFGRDRHDNGQLDEDLKLMVNSKLLVRKDECPPTGFEYSLTAYGKTLAQHILDEATWKIALVPGRQE